MPLGERSGDKESRYCGVETEFSDDVPQLLAYNLSSSSFDFVLAPLIGTLRFVFLYLCYGGQLASHIAA
uniref:Uncharacterized protein n=1 Tax=Fagus sylvatica TaxID=28930 RepID=A0A2N9EF48_FAGSY